jgi:hypothetical protein
MATPPKYLHVSFAFLPEDKELLAHCAKQSGLTQTELIRRLLRNYAAGVQLIGLIPIKKTRAALAWTKGVEA